MSLPRRPEAVVFDMDGLLFDTETLYRDSLLETAKRLGIDLPLPVALSVIGLPSVDSKRLVDSHFGGKADIDALWAGANDRFHEKAALQVDLKAGVLELLDHLDAAKMPRAIATSSRHEAVTHHLGQHSLIERFPVVVARGDYPRGKPNPDPFLIAAQRLGIAPELCLALEDSHNGVRAASSAGMMTVMVPDLLEATDEMHTLCVRIARDLHDVREVLQAAF